MVGIEDRWADRQSNTCVLGPLKVGLQWTHHRVTTKRINLSFAIFKLLLLEIDWC